MAVYKVPQDVEADDKFLGPLTFKQFLFFGGAAISGYLMFISYTKQWWPVLAVILPFFLGFTALAIPWSKDQPTELWLAARIRFILMPRKRIWDQSGVKDLVEITVPKRPVHIYSDGLSQDQVRNRLNALATVVDTRGWAVKNLTPNNQIEDESDRLVNAPMKLNEINERNQIVNNTMDVLDEYTSPVSEQFTGLINESTKKHHNEIIESMHSVQNKPQLPDSPTQPVQPIVMQAPAPVTIGTSTNEPSFATMSAVTPDEQQLLDKIHEKKQEEISVEQFNRMGIVQPVAPQSVSATRQTTSTAPVDPAILALAHNDDLSVLTLAHQAGKEKPDESQEVVVSLH